MIEETKEKLKKIGKEQYIMNLLILIFAYGTNDIAKGMSGNYYINYMITGIVFVIYLAYYKIYLINVIENKNKRKINKRMFFNIFICNYIIFLIVMGIGKLLAVYLNRGSYIIWLVFIIGYLSSSIIMIIFSPIEYTFFKKDYMFFEGVIIGCKLLNKKKRNLFLNNIKILGTQCLNIITIKIFTIKSSGLIYGINYSSVMD